MRLFAALALPDATRDRLEGLQGGLPEAKRVESANFHVTLEFFGDVGGPAAEDLDASLSCISATRFDLWLDGVDVFGGDRPRLAYAQVRPAPELVSLHEKVRAAAKSADVATEDRRYAPHATLARFRGGRMDERLRRWLEGNAAFLDGPIAIDNFTLFESRLGHVGPVYTALKTYPLK